MASSVMSLPEQISIRLFLCHILQCRAPRDPLDTGTTVFASLYNSKCRCYYRVADTPLCTKTVQHLGKVCCAHVNALAKQAVEQPEALVTTAEAAVLHVCFLTQVGVLCVMCCGAAWCSFGAGTQAGWYRVLCIAC